MEGRYNLKVSDFARTMARAADAAEGKQLGHARCIAHLAYLLAREEGLSDEDCQYLILSGLFHDLGWILLAPDVARVIGGVDEDLLRLHPCIQVTKGSEFHLLLSEHALIVSDFLSSLSLPRAVGDDIALSHEAWDGSGVPDGLAGSEIPDRALILAVADHAVTLLNDYVDEQSAPLEAIHQLEAYASRILDPDLVTSAIEILSADDGWASVTDCERAEALIDEALYPIFSDFVDLSSPVPDLWADLIGQLADRYHPLVPEHSAQVKAMAGAVAGNMGLSVSEARELEVAACLAEIGRVGLPPELVFRLGAFTEEERELLRAYPTVGERIIEPMRAVAPIFRAAITHREKLNGSGYPEGLKGDEIPLGGRILCVADTFVALTADSPQRSAYSTSLTLSILQAESTKLFDGLVVDALEAVVAPTLALR